VTPEGPSRTQRRFVAGLLALLCVPGVIGLDLWPLTGWRLFSANRQPTQVRLVLEAIAADGSVSVVDPDDLPYGFRNMEFALLQLPEASDAKKAEVCRVLLDAAAVARPGTVAVRVAYDKQELVDTDDGYVVGHRTKELTTCSG
jgi:hypothetical protein